ncbi:hypothetical protein N752_17485 [Desulforamulus aquiferis]|nr:type 2 isopentenyl-diphosphate Delta-isomerase [Desulforamulus aquiferis]RYD03874.1 hypothetical protein N752_17485 [Desulforamulus aquiferis]
MRINRKLEHIELSLNQKKRSIATGFEDVSLVHNSLPQLNWEEVDPSCEFLGKKLSVPLLINAMTGGHPQLEGINYSLARAANLAGVAIAVGSQRAALEDHSARASFKVVREANPRGVVLANLGADCSELEARAAIEMINADAIQLHLNVPQEMAMREGDRQFRGILGNIELLVKHLSVPIIVKEVGFGMSRESFRRLCDIGVRNIDIGGAGGTDFMAIEENRAGRMTMWSWGIPTAISLLEGIEECKGQANLIASGGIEHALDCVKALCLGCHLVGIARPLLKVLMSGSDKHLDDFLELLKADIRRIMLMLGAKTIKDLTSVSAVISGNTYHWLCQRGIS